MGAAGDGPGCDGGDNGQLLAFRDLFESAPACLLVLDPDLGIVAVTDAFLEATMTQRQAILGRPIFEVFPDNPDDSSADGVANLSASLQRVMATRRPDQMEVQKYDIRRPAACGGGYEVRYWSPTNSPVLDEHGCLRFIIHRVVDVTEQVATKSALVEAIARQEVSAERERIAHELHESVIDELFRAGIALQGVLGRHPEPGLAGKVEVVVESLDHTIATVRSAVYSLEVPRVADEGHSGSREPGRAG